MTDVEREESKKTVVAFITGLLIGGLLVWVFSSTPATNDLIDDVDEDDQEEIIDNDDDEDVVDTDEDDEDSDGNGSFSVADQKAGSSVALESDDFPTKTGWVVVRDYADGVAGRILGAARYDVDGGLVPSAVPLVRNTVAGNTYQVVFYTSEGNLGFNSGEDKPMDVAGTTFEAN
jgi:hypothetical protein